MKENSAGELINQNTLNKSYKYLSIYNLITEVNQLHLKYISFSKTNNIKELDPSLILSSNDIKLIYFIFKYLNNSLKNNIYILSNIKFTSKIINDQNNNVLNHSLISKFINFLLLNPKTNEQFFNIKGINNINEDIFKNKIYHIMKLLFLKGNLSTSEVNMILLTNLLTCFNSNNNIIENTIKNIQPLYSIINFFLSFINITNYLSENNLKKYNDLVSNFINNLNKYILSNNNNLFSLSRNNQIFKLIQLDKISVSLKHIIIPLLVNVYKYKFNIDIVFEGINSQFLLYNNENIEQKTNLMMAKNIFLNNLFSQEKSLLCGKEFYIRNGFYFNDFENNGIICSSMNTFSKEGYTIVLSFNLKYNKNNKKYNIFSIFREKNIIRLYIENNKLFLNTCNNQNIELFNDIKYDNDYVFWMVHPNKKKLQLLFYLNNNKNFINNINCYPSDNYGISLGFDKKSNNRDNFIGIIGTFILFNKCLIENKNDNQNETKLISLKGNYESLIYINTKRDFANYDKNTNLILNKYSLIEDISKYIEITISNKSIVNNILFGEMHREFNCNYFNFYNSGNNNKFYFNNFQSVINNLNYIVEYKNSLEQFLFNHGILYLQLELYFFIGFISYKISNDINFSSNDSLEMNINIHSICSLFFFCFQNMNSYQEALYQNEIKNFLITLQKLITIMCERTELKIKGILLSLFFNYFQILLSKNLLFIECDFLFKLENYDLNDAKVLEILFQGITNNLDEFKEREKIKEIFEKLLMFDKIYINENIKKEIKKYYSIIIQKVIKIIIEENENYCVNLYLKKINEFTKNIQNVNLFFWNVNENNNNLINNNKNEVSKSTNDACYNDNNKLNNLILLYKYLKNLYFVIGLSKELNYSFCNIICNDRKEKLLSFFNEIFIFLQDEYKIEEVSILTDEIKYSEYLKCLCVIFIDIIFYKDNIKLLENFKKAGKKSQIKKFLISNYNKSDIQINNEKKTGSFHKKNTSSFLQRDEIGNNISDADNLLISSNISSTFIGSGNRGSFIENSKISSKNKIVYQNETDILTSKMFFFNDIILSPFTFRSFFILIFPEVKNSTKWKFIKNNKTETKFLFANKDYLHYIYLIFRLFNKISEDSLDTIFMNKYKFLEYCYEIFNRLIINTIDYYLENKKKDIKSIISDLIKYKNENLTFYYLILNIVTDYINSYVSDNDLTLIGDKSIKEKKIDNDPNQVLLENLIKKIKDDIKLIIDKTIYEFEDPFYFKLLFELFKDENNNNTYVFETVQYLIDKFILFQDKLLLESNNNINCNSNNINTTKDSSNSSSSNNTVITNFNIYLEINNKNLLILIYKITFYIQKRNIIISNEFFLRKLFAYLSTYISFSKLLFTKILFNIDDFASSFKKIIFEMLYDIILEYYLEYLRNPKNYQLQIFEDLLFDLLYIKNFSNHKLNCSIMISIKTQDSNKKKNHTTCYTMDKIEIKKEKIFKISDGVQIKTNDIFSAKEYIISSYKNEHLLMNNQFCVCIIFMIKILISLNILNEIIFEDISKQENNNTLSNFTKLKQNLISVFWQLCEDTLQLQKKYSETDPLLSNSNIYKNKVYTYFKNFILNEFVTESSNYDLNKLINKLADFKTYIRPFQGIIYTNTKVLLYTKKNYRLLTKNSYFDKDNEESGNPSSDNDLLIINNNKNFDKNENFNEDLNYPLPNVTRMTVGGGSCNLIDNFCKMESNKSFIPFGRNSDLYMFDNRNTTFNKNRRFSNTISKDLNFDLDKICKNEQNNNIYFETIKLKKDLLRTYFSSYCLNLLTNDEDFILLKKLYKYVYIDEIQNVISLDENNDEKFNVSNFNFASKIKNFICNKQYSKIFLKKDFKFFENNEYFKYSHKYIVNTINETVVQKQKTHFYNNKKILGFNTKIKLLFPSKKLMQQNIKIPNLKFYSCELITNKGAIFGKILIYGNGILFCNLPISNPKLDLRNNKKESNLNFCCSSLEYDCLYENKIIFIAFEEIKEIINRTFCFSWTSHEIFLKNNKSYLFNFYTEKTNYSLFDIYKNKKLCIIKNPKEYIESSDIITQWKNGLINNYDYLLLLNKLCSRSYNDYNQYPIMPWIFLRNKEIRNFDIPISVQKEEQKNYYLKKIKEENFDNQENYYSNHYSTSAYVFFYLMRVNPFTNDMIKFQSNDFDVPDRQFSDISKTLELCEDFENNREPIPEIYNFPEIYMNLNYNDLGRQKNQTRIHNVELEPYANNPIEFCYKLRNKINLNKTINKNINQWFDFIFGVNQWADDPTKNNLRLFNAKTYAQNVSLKKIINEGIKVKKDNKEIYDTVKTYISFAINLGQTPFQIFSEIHPQKNLDFVKNNNMDINVNQEIISKPKERNNIIYFNIGIDKQNINCLLSDKSLEIYSISNKNNNKKNKLNNNYELIREIKPKGQFLLFKKTKNNKLIYKPDYIFCELKQDVFIFCRYLDNTLKIFNVVSKQKLKTECSYLLPSYITTIIRINDNEFITGDILGNIVKWKLKNNLELISKIKSNTNSITCINYNEKIGILLICDNNNLVIRKYYDFEFLTLIKVQNIIVDVKISDYDLIYVLTYVMDKNLYELYCYSLNGMFACKYQGNFSNFQFTKSGNIIICDLDDNAIHVLNAYDFNLIYSKKLNIDKDDKVFQFIFEENKIIYLGIENDKMSKINKIYIEPNEESYFY